MTPSGTSRTCGRRRAIAARLRFIGLEVFVDYSRDGDEKLLLLSAPDDLLEEVAERVAMKKKLKIGSYTEFLRSTKRLFQPASDSGDDARSFFTSLERCRLILAMLTLDLTRGGAALDLEAEREDGVITAVIPIHESPNSMTMQRLMRHFRNNDVKNVRGYADEAMFASMPFIVSS